MTFSGQFLIHPQNNTLVLQDDGDRPKSREYKY
jgi:hypothetical protein